MSSLEQFKENAAKMAGFAISRKTARQLHRCVCCGAYVFDAAQDVTEPGALRSELERREYSISFLCGPCFDNIGVRTHA
jgi:hypothetical protein